MNMLQKKEDNFEFYEKLKSLVIPITLQTFMLAAVGAGDAAMLGLLNQNSLAAVSLANQIHFVLTLFLTTITSGATILISQYWGKGENDVIRVIFRLILRYAAVISIVFSLAAICIPEYLMKIFSSENTLILIGGDYLRICGVGYLFTAISQCYLCLMKTTGLVKKAVFISVIALFSDTIMNAVFIFGLLGVPALGVKGAALTTVLSRTIELILVFLVCQKRNLLKDNDDKKQEVLKDIKKDFWYYSIPVLINELIWGIGTAVYSVIIGHLGSDVTAANAIVAVIRDLILCLGRGISRGGGILIGNVLGSNNQVLAKDYGKKICGMSWISAFFSAFLILIVGHWTVNIMPLSDTAKNYLEGMLIISAVYMIAKNVNVVVVCGIFNAGGDTRFDAISVAISMWLCTIPMALVAAFWWKLSALTVYLIINVDEIIKIPWVFRHYKKYKWVKNITREI